jgi:hypothetical protein
MGSANPGGNSTLGTVSDKSDPMHFSVLNFVFRAWLDTFALSHGQTTCFNVYSRRMIDFDSCKQYANLAVISVA